MEKYQIHENDVYELVRLPRAVYPSFSKEEHIENCVRKTKEINQREDLYKQMVDQSRTSGEKVVISTSIVIDGLKFIAENQDMDQISLVQGLLDLGCNFTVDEIKQQFSDEGLLYDGIERGKISCGAFVIANVRDSEIAREFTESRFLRYDNELSIYHFIRCVTGEQNYTKENIDSMTKESRRIK